MAIATKLPKLVLRAPTWQTPIGKQCLSMFHEVAKLLHFSCLGCCELFLFCSGLLLVLLEGCQNILADSQQQNYFVVWHKPNPGRSPYYIRCVEGYSQIYAKLRLHHHGTNVSLLLSYLMLICVFFFGCLLISSLFYYTDQILQATMKSTIELTLSTGWLQSRVFWKWQPALPVRL
jgi:hypothetical protein